jgi:hypothetical protein
MKTSFSVKVTGSITVSIEPSNEDGGGGGDFAEANDGGSILEVFLESYMKSLVNDAVKKYVTTVEEEDEDLSSPLPKRRIPANADDSVEDDDDDDDDSVEEKEEEEEASVEEEEDDDDDDEAGDLPNVQVEYRYADDNSLSQKMNMMNLRRK